MGISKIKNANKLLASYWGYNARGEWTNIRKRFKGGNEGKAAAMAWLVAEQKNKIAPPEMSEDTRLRTIRSAMDFFTNRSHFTARDPRSQRQAIYRLALFVQWCEDNGTPYLAGFTERDAEKFAVFCQKTYKRKGIEGRLSLVYRLFKVEIERFDSSIAKNPFQNVKRTGYDPPLRIEHLSEGEIDKILSCIEPRKQAIITILFESGMRADELQHLRWCDIGTHIDISSRAGTAEMVGWNTKTGEAGGIRITRGMQTALDFLRMRTGRQEYVLLGDRPAHETYLNKMMKRIEKKVRDTYPDMPHFSPHTFRRSVAMYLINQGEQLHIVQRFLRHQKPETTSRSYGRAFLKQLDSSVAILERRKTA